MKGGMLISSLVGVDKRSITIMAYPLVTILAEKLETVISRDVVNTRLARQ